MDAPHVSPRDGAQRDVTQHSVARGARWLLGFALLFALPALLRLAPIGHGAPHPEYVPDTHIVRNALGMANDRDPVPPVAKYSSYPYLLSYVLLPVYAADFALGRARGEWSGAAEYGDRLRADPWRAHWLARVTLALLALTAPLFVFLTARAAGLQSGAWIAAWLAGTCLLHVHLSLHERPWAPMASAIAGSCWMATLHARDGRRRALLGSAAFAAAAASMHQAGLFALAAPGIAWFVAPRAGERGAAALRAKVPLGFAAVALFAAIALLVGYPTLLRYGLTKPEQVAGYGLDEGVATTSAGGQHFVLGLDPGNALPQLRGLFGYDPVLLVLGLVGVAFALRRRAALAPSVVFALFWGALFLLYPVRHLRYELPALVMLAVPAGAFVERFARTRPLRLLALIVLMVPAVQALRLGAILRTPDTRALATERLAETLGPDARVAIDIYGPIIEPDVESLRLRARLRPLYGREAFRLARLEAGATNLAPGAPNVRLQDALEFDASRGTSWVRTPGAVDLEPPLDLGETARSALDALGATHVLVVDRTPGDGVPPPLLDPTPPATGQRRLAPLDLGEPLWTITPGEGVRDGHLPAAMDFPLLDLWRMERPGPWLALYPL